MSAWSSRALNCVKTSVCGSGYVDQVTYSVLLVQYHEYLNTYVERPCECDLQGEGLTELRKKPLFCQLVFSGRNEGGDDGLSKYRTSHRCVYEPSEAL